MIRHQYRTILGPIPDEWDAVPLRKALVRSSSGDWGDDRGEVPMQVLRSTNFRGDRTLEMSDIEQRWFSAEHASRFDIRAGDFLLERSGGGPRQPVGRIARVDDDLPGCGFSNFVQLLRADDKEMVPGYLGWCLFELHRSGIIERLQHQTTQMRNLDFRDYLRVLLPRPPLEVQERIAGPLDATDAAVKSTERALGRLQETGKSLVIHLLRNGAPGRRHERIDSEIGVLPAEWELVPLSQLAEIEAGVTLNSERSPRNRVYRYLTVINVQRDAIVENERRYLELKESEIPRKLLAPGDILVVEGHANKTEIGRAALVKNDHQGLTYQNHLFRVRVTDAKIDPRFLVHALNSEHSQRHWAKVANTSSGLNTINRRQLRGLWVPKPPIDEQISILEFLQTHARSLRSLMQQRASGQRLLRALLQSLLVGRARVRGLSVS